MTEAVSAGWVGSSDPGPGGLGDLQGHRGPSVCSLLSGIVLVKHQEGVDLCRSACPAGCVSGAVVPLQVNVY